MKLKTLRGLGRLLYFAAYSAIKVSEIILKNLLFGKDPNRAMRIRKRWARHLLPAIGVQLEVHGEAPDYPCILMGNHRSYLDPAVILHDAIACPVSKAEVASWPIVGYGAKVSGILFLQRESSTSRKQTLQGIAGKLREGIQVMLFPEGTTHGEPACREFRPGGFRLAAQENIPIVPVALDYSSPEDYWIGDATFLPHFLQRFSEPHMRVIVRYGTPVQSRDPQYLIETTRQWIDRELIDIRKSFK